MENLGPKLRRTFSDWNGHEAPRLGAALAFYTILSLAPLVILVLAGMTLFFGHSAAEDQILGLVEGMIGQDGAMAVKTMIEHAQKPAAGTLASIVGVSTLVFGASGIRSLFVTGVPVNRGQIAEPGSSIEGEDAACQRRR